MIRNLKQYIYLIQHNGSSSSSVHHNNTSRLHEWLSERNKTRSRNAAHSITCKLIFRKAETNGRSSALNKKKAYLFVVGAALSARERLFMFTRAPKRAPPAYGQRAGGVTDRAQRSTYYVLLILSRIHRSG